MNKIHITKDKKYLQISSLKSQEQNASLTLIFSTSNKALYQYI